MTEGVVDLRSDTLTVPTPPMREAMAQAAVGDDVYGEDPTVNGLQERVAALFGHEAGLFTASGSLSNQLGLRLLVGPGQEVIADEEAHILRAELGSAAALAGITSRTYGETGGLVDPPRITAMVRPFSNPYLVATSAIAVENTHNFGGGRVQPLGALRQVRSLADEYGLAMHLDGARIWNAHVATGIPLAEYGSLFETVSVCFSKGLGAPVGSMLLASSERIAEARVWRKRLGGGMRQVGFLAAAAEYALVHHLADLAEDHRRARELADVLATAAPGVVDATIVETNIVLLDLSAAHGTATDLASVASARGVRIGVLGPHHARLVTHLGVDDDDVTRAAEVLTSALMEVA